MTIDFHALNRSLLAHGEAILADWLPAGKRSGNEWVCGDLLGNPGHSCKVNLDTGKWADFAASGSPGQSGLDLVSLYASIHHLDNVEAARRIVLLYRLEQHTKRVDVVTKSNGRVRRSNGKALNGKSGNHSSNIAGTKYQHGTHAETSDLICPVPDGVAAPDCVFKLGPLAGLAPSRTWRYVSGDGHTIGYVARYDRSGMPKQLRPWVYTAVGWQSRAFPGPRPLYGLEQLALRPKDAVLLGEGEKVADAVRQLVPDCVAVTWPGGAPGWKYADWSPLYGRHVILCPDPDEPGIAAMQGIGKLLAGHGCWTEWIDTTGQPPAWDLADALEEGWSASDVQKWIAAHLGDVAEVLERSEIEDERAAIREDGSGIIEIEEPAAESFIQRAPAYLAKEEPPIEYLINELLPSGIIALLHGEPRTRKSWIALDIAIGLATGTSAFGLNRFSVVPGPVPVLYCSQEDGDILVKARAKALLRGRGIDKYPDELCFSVHAGIELESLEWKERLIMDLKTYGIRLVIFDPIRRFAADADKGPAEVRSITAYLRQLVNETGTSVLIVHHDVKPPQLGQDTRRRGHRASGGDWFASAECPIACEVVGENQTVCYPESYKLSMDPEPWTFRIESDDSRRPTVANLIGETATAVDAQNLAIDDAIVSYLLKNPGATGTTIGKALQKRKGDVFSSLDRLYAANKVDCVDGPHRSKLWTIFSGSRGSRGLVVPEA